MSPVLTSKIYLDRARFPDRVLDVTNLSFGEEYQIREWLPPNLPSGQLILFPDLGPTDKGILPTGSVFKTSLGHAWEPFAVSDCGCGMQLLRTTIDSNDICADRNDRRGAKFRGSFEKLGLALKEFTGLGSLGGGNHFIDVIQNKESSEISFLIHTGGREESMRVAEATGDRGKFVRSFTSAVSFARANRDRIADTVRRFFPNIELVLDLPHNTIQIDEVEDTITVRKGSVQVAPGEISILPSAIDDEIALIEATPEVTSVLNSMCHGTGRIKPRGLGPNTSEDLKVLREMVVIPDYIKDASIASEVSDNYRPLRPVLERLAQYIKVRELYTVVGYLGHL